MPHTISDLEVLVTELASVFEAKNIKYVVIGGVAVGQLTRPRYTKDVDFLVEVPQLLLPSILEEIIAKGGDLELIPAIKAWNANHMLVFTFNGIRVDWLKPVIPAYAHVIASGIATTVNTIPVRIASSEGLILLKLLAFRLQDQVDIESLIATRRSELNLAWIDTEWQTIGELTDPPMKWFKERYNHIITGGS